jgi:chloramphenicol 3-O phosphotransferase
MTDVGQIVILNGPSRSGKTSVATAIQRTFEGLWMGIGMDLHIKATPPAYRPGVGLRPMPPEHTTRTDSDRLPLELLEDKVPVLYAALYESVAAHSRLGLNVVTDVYHHDFYTRPRRILADCARRLSGLPVLFVGVLCPIDVIWERREATWGQNRDAVGEDVRTAVELGQRAAREHRYDLEVDTSRLSPDECADAIRRRLAEGPPGSAMELLARP